MRHDIGEIKNDVKALLQSRAANRAVSALSWKTVTLIVSVLTAAVLLYK